MIIYPNDYYRRLVDMALTAGDIMINSGAETHRVEDMISRILRTTEFPQADAFVLTTGITVTLSDGKENTFSITRRIAPGSTNMGRITEVNAISRAFCSGNLTLEKAEERLNAVKDRHEYSHIVKCLATMLATSMFTYIFGGGFWEAVASCLCGLVIGVILNYGGKLITRGFILVLVGAAAVTMTGLGLREAAQYVGIELQAQYIIVGAIMPVVPGMAITNAIRDILQGDYLASGSRIIEAFMTAAAVALGVGGGMFLGSVCGMTLETLEFASRGEILLLRAAAEGVAAFFSIVAFCVIFEIPKKYIVLSSLTAGVCWEVYLAACVLGLSVPWASFFSGMAAYLLAYIFAKVKKAPVTLFLVGGVLPLVPGISIYKTAYYTLTSKGDASDALTQTLLIAGTIALAVFVMDSVIEIVMKIFKRKAKENGNIKVKKKKRRRA